MATSEVHVYDYQTSPHIEISAEGGTRRERGAAIAAAVRNYPHNLTRYHISYSETYGFQSATYAKYTKKCGCGTPNRANVYIDLTIGKGDSRTGTQTETVDAYTCDEHNPLDPKDILHPDIARDGWYVIDATAHRIR